MARTLSQGMTGQDVRALQDALNYQIRRGTPLKVDGIFGPKTLERVREFQRANQLVVDGLAGPKTQGLLYEVTDVIVPILFLPSLQLTLPELGSPPAIRPPQLIPPLRWPGPPAPPSPPFTLGNAFKLDPASLVTLPSFATPANGLGLKITVPTRQDPVDPTVASRQAIVDMIGNLPVDSKFKAFLVSKVPNTVTRIEPPGTGFKWGLEPLFDPFDPKGFGVKGNAKFTVQVSQGADGKPNVVFGAWGDGKFFLDFTSKQGKARPQVQAQGSVFLGLQGVF
jgi:peptidoglycan hydrolase-like protein with peptidoglycan-binding domain